MLWVRCRSAASFLLSRAPGCYEGMIVGERSKAGDMVVNIARTKNLGNQRSSTSDISVQLVPPRTFSLEEAAGVHRRRRAG